MERGSKSGQGSLLDNKPASNPGQEPKGKKSDKQPTAVATVEQEQDTSSTAATVGRTVALNTVQGMQATVIKFTRKLLADRRAEEFATWVALMARNNPKIGQAIKENPETFLGAIMACATFDLMPNTPEGQAYVIPYNSKHGMEVQFQLGYKGLIKLARRSGEILTLDAELVFKGDEFDVVYGTERRITHRPDLSVDRTKYENVTHAYATATLANGEHPFAVMTRKELDKIQKTAKAQSTDAPWNTWPERMALKTILKRFSQTLPSSTQDERFQKAVAADSLAEAGRLRADKETGDIIEGEAVELNSVTIDAINEATDRDQLAEIMQDLPVAERKKAAPIVDARLKELEDESTSD